MSNHSKNETARNSVDRISRLERRMYNILRNKHKSPNLGEVSAIEWAIPILKQYVMDRFGYLPPSRYPLYKHERTEIKEFLWKRDGNICYICGQELSLHASTIDHVIPLSKGGTDDMTNYRLVHNECNLLKGNETIEQKSCSTLNTKVVQELNTKIVQSKEKQG